MADLLAHLFSGLNTLLLGIFGISLILSKRWRHLRWLPAWALTLFICSLAYRSFLHTPEFSLVKRLVGELLALGAVVEILRKDADKRPFWPWLALAGLTIVPFLPLNPAMRYYLPQEIFAIGLALEMPTALRKRSAPLAAWSLIGMATLISDGLKMIAPSRVIWQILIQLDIWFFTGFALLLLGGLFLPELQRLKELLFNTGGPHSTKLQHAAHGGAPSGNLAAPPESNVITFGRFESRSQWKAELEAISKKLDALNTAIGLATLNAPHWEKPFLSRDELAFYLGTSPEVAERFVDDAGIERHWLTDEPDKWVVRREDVRKNLMHV